MPRNRITPLLSALLVLTPWPALAQDNEAGPSNPRVIAASVRQETLETAEELLNRGDVETKQAIALSVTPMFPPAPEEPEEVAPPPEPVMPGLPAPPPPRVVEQPKRLSDDEALSRITEQFRPSGSLILGERRFVLAGSQRVPLGTVFTARIDGQTYRVEVSSITQNDYTLRLGGAELTLPYFRDRLQGSITREN